MAMNTQLLKQVLQLRLDYAQSAAKKFAAIERTELDGRVQETLQAWGATRTGRWAGRILQIHNMKRSPKEAERIADTLVESPEAFRVFYSLSDLGGLARSAITAPQGYRLVVADLGSIESRVLGWMARCRWINDVFAQNLDTYRAFGNIWLGIPYDQIDKETRNLCKPPFLGFGYGIGAARLQDYAADMGVAMKEEQCASAISTARKVCWEVPKFWKQIETAFIEVLTTGQTSFNQFSLKREGRFITMRLPSGRKLYYDLPAWNLPDEGGKYENCISYLGQNQYTGQWQRLTTWGGKLTENRDQAIARDLLVHGMSEYTREGGTIVGHVHDEVIAVEPENQAENRLALLIDCLCRVPSWMPGLILDAEGYIARRFRKG